MGPVDRANRVKARAVRLPPDTMYTATSDSEQSERKENIYKRKKTGKVRRPRKEPKPVMANLTKTTKSKRVSIEDTVDMSDDEDEDIRVLVRRRPDAKEILGRLDKAATEFLLSVKSIEEVKALTRAYSVEKMMEIEESIGSVAKLLRSRRAPTATKTPKTGALESLDQHFIFRDVKQTVYLLAPVEVFKATKSIQNKTFGFVRRAGNYWPLMCALSGITNIVPQNDKLLDSEFWAHEVYRFGMFGEVQLGSSPYEACQGLPHGTHFSGHIEPKLMLFYACRILCKILGSDVPASVRKQLAYLGQIKGQGIPQPMAEIVLDRDPCSYCKGFQKHIEGITGIKFTFIVCPKLGKVKLEKDMYGNSVFPLNVEEYVHSDDSETDGGSTIQAVIPQRPAAPAQIYNPHKSRGVSKFQAVTKMAAKKPRQLTPEYDLDENEDKDMEEDDDTRSLYMPVTRRSRYETPVSSEKRLTRMSSTLSPDQSYEFGYENLARAKKRKFNWAKYYASPISAKKSRRTEN